MSEELVLGFPDADGEVVLISPERPIPDGCGMFEIAKDRSSFCKARETHFQPFDPFGSVV